MWLTYRRVRFYISEFLNIYMDFFMDFFMDFTEDIWDFRVVGNLLVHAIAVGKFLQHKKKIQGP